MHRPLAWLAAAAAVFACDARVPLRPDALRPGTFALTLRGTTAGPRRLTFDETLTGSACRVAEYVRLDSRWPSRHLLVHLPQVPRMPTRYRLATGYERPRVRGAAYAHLNVPPAMNGGLSLQLVGGSVTAAAQGPRGVQGTLEARIAQPLMRAADTPGGAMVRGAFRADACDDWTPVAPVARAR